MSAVDDYLNSLEGQDNLNALEVASKMHELHTQEIGTREAKIEELNGVVSEKDTALSTRDQEITTWKAKNFDLAMQIPGATVPPTTGQSDSGVDGATITVDDLFAKKG
jgi:hypothetical protein